MEEGAEGVSGGFFVAETAFPQAYHAPAEEAQLHGHTHVASLVEVDFSLPELVVGGWEMAVSASFVSMPEAAVDEDGGAVFGQHDVGAAGEAADMDAEAEAIGEQKFAHNDFGAGVLALYRRHAAVTLFGCHSVGHIVLKTKDEKTKD